VLLAGLGVAAALGTFSSSDTRKPAPHQPAKAALAAANPDAGTVRCASSACTQLGGHVVPPIEGSPCTAQGRAGQWDRIDAGGKSLLFGCTPAVSPPAGTVAVSTLPDLGGARLDYAERLLDRLGVRHDTSGGGVFGIVDSGNWTVCTTKPVPGAALARGASVKLFVDRSC
jgi:hypothetical protein